MALTACSVLEDTYGLKLYDENKRKALADNMWQGRMERVASNIYVDGAHNPHGISKLVQSVDSMYEASKQKAALLFSVVSDKNFDEMIAILCSSRAFHRIAVTVTGGKRQLDREYIRAAFARHTKLDIEVYSSAGEALYALRNENMIFCAGSLYLVADIKEALKNL